MPHVEAVTLPQLVRVNTPAVIECRISADASPNFFMPDAMLFYVSSTPAFERGVSEGRYKAGKFLGLFAGALPGQAVVSLGQRQPDTSVTVTFTAAGRQVLYFGHSRTAADGGRSSPQKSPDYPAESEIIEYLKVEVDVQP